MNPGVYVIRDKEFRVDSNARLTGDGVTIYLMDDSSVLRTSNTRISLSAPTGGPTKGMLIYSDPNNDSEKHFFDSNNIAELSGVIYMPNDIFEVNSNSETTLLQTSDHTVLIADTFYFDSNVVFVLNGDFENSGIPLPDGMGIGGAGVGFALVK